MSKITRNTHVTGLMRTTKPIADQSDLGVPVVFYLECQENVIGLPEAKLISLIGNDEWGSFVSIVSDYKGLKVYQGSWVIATLPWPEAWSEEDLPDGVARVIEELFAKTQSFEVSSTWQIIAPVLREAWGIEPLTQKELQSLAKEWGSERSIGEHPIEDLSGWLVDRNGVKTT